MFKVLMVCFAVVFQSAVVFAQTPQGFDKATCTFKGIPLKGKVKIVEHFPDIQIKMVEHFPDLKVKVVEHFPDECGKWQWVEHFPDFTVKIVEHFPDLQIKQVDHFPGVE